MTEINQLARYLRFIFRTTDLIAVVSISVIVLLELDLFAWSFAMGASVVYLATRSIQLIVKRIERQYFAWFSLVSVFVLASSVLVAPSCNEWLVKRNLGALKSLATYCKDSSKSTNCDLAPTHELIADYVRIEQNSETKSIWIAPHGRKGLVVFVESGDAAYVLKDEPCVSKIEDKWYLIRRC
jgi:hypothetical protein